MALIDALETKVADIRSKSEAERMRYLFLITAGVMVLVVGIWILTIVQEFSSVSEPALETVNTVKETAKDGQKSLESLQEAKQNIIVPLDGQSETGQDFISEMTKTRQATEIPNQPEE